MSRMHQPYMQNDILTNCETYMSKLLKRRSEKPRQLRPTYRTSQQVQLARMPVPKNSLVPITKSDKTVPSGDEELVLKEVLNNKMAQVEVTVRTVSARSRSNSLSDKREPWAKLLNQNVDNESRRSIDYALGTIHYLSRELQKKLQVTCPSDPSIHQLVNDIQNTLYRLGPDIGSVQEFFPSENDLTDLQKNKKDYSKRLSQGTQTSLAAASEISLRDEQYAKMENTCKRIESNCQKLKLEKEKIENELKLEKEMVEKLKQEINEQFSERNDKTMKILKELHEERDRLEEELKNVKNMDSDSAPIAELNNTIQKLKNDNSSLEYENLNLKYEITVMKLEKEKMSFLLESRDKQLKALRSEIDNIQSIVCSQLIDIKNEYIPTTLSRTSLESLWKSSQIQLKKGDKSEPLQELFSSVTKHFENIVESEGAEPNTVSKSKIDFGDEYPQRDVPYSKTDKNIVPSDMTLNSDNAEELESNIKEMFAELKRQALAVTMSNEPVDN